MNFSVSVPVWKNNDSTSACKTRATPISGTTLDRSSSFNIIADAYDGKSSYSTIINNETVSYTNSMWQTTTSHYYWPGNANNTLNFYAYYPTTISSSITHTAGSAPSLSYTVPNDATSQIDIMTATANNVSGSTNSSTPLTFSHIFAAIQFSVGSVGMPNGTITGITLNNILYKGTYNFNGTWTQDATSKKSFSQTVSASTNAGTAITSGAMTFMMMPQTLGSDASITVTYSNSGTLTQTIAGTWNAGKIYTYNVSKTIPVATFDYTGDAQSYAIPLDGTYKLEVWGAEGGSGWDMTVGGKGGYSCGNVKISKGQIIYIIVGGKGNPGSGRVLGGYNGGGQSTINGQSGPDGGGATHMSTTNRGQLSNYASYKNEILLVAGGGGGSERNMGGDGGGSSGSPGSLGYTSILTAATGGTQTSGGNAGTTSNNGNAESGSFGKGGNGYVSSSQDAGGAGGGGWYGGGGVALASGGGGGSGYIGGVINGSMQTGVKSGDGYAKITFVSAN